MNNRAGEGATIFAALLFFVFIGFLIWMQVGVWNECRDTNSWWYCVNLIRR